MTKLAALKLARQLRAKGQNVKAYCRSGVYCQPGRGLVSFAHYYVA